MKKLIYPALFHKEDASYWVEFPDLPGCQSFADTLPDVYENAKEALSTYCVTLLEQGKSLPCPSDICAIKTSDTNFVSLVEADIRGKSQSVKKTLTIPSWLNTLAEEQHINFSGVLQDALLDQLNLRSS